MESIEEIFQKHFPRKDDLTIKILKAHLIIEEAANQIIESLCHDFLSVQKMTLRLEQKLDLIRALDKNYEKHFPPEMYLLAKKLNTIRNKLAHHLDYEKINQLLENFVTCVPKEYCAYPEHSLEAKMIYSVTFLIGAFAQLALQFKSRAFDK